MSVIDADSGENGRYICAIDNENFLLEKMYSTEFKLVTANRFDRETTDTYVVAITCRDFGENPMMSVASVIVHVTDENDHAPQFATQSMAVEVYENLPVGSEIIRVEATDPDAGINSEVVYGLSHPATDYLTINETTGAIQIKNVLDRETIGGELVFDVIARDKGKPERTSIQRVLLNILDIDDERPTFLTNRYVFTVEENLQPLTVVGRVAAVDRDITPFNKFTYHIDPRQEAVINLFDVNATTGEIRTKQVLDRENRPVHYLSILAVPMNDPAYSVSASVTVYVSDANDHRPRFRYPAFGNETIKISSQTPIGHEVAKIKAFDPDAGKNSNLTFALTDGNRDNAFFLDPHNGSLKLAADMGMVRLKEYHLTMSVRDGGDHPLTSTTRLHIIVSMDIVFVPPVAHTNLLANENMVIVLAVTLAVILMAITVITVVHRSGQDGGQEKGHQGQNNDAGEERSEAGLSGSPVLRWQTSDCRFKLWRSRDTAECLHEWIRCCILGRCCCGCCCCCNDDRKQHYGHARVN